MTYQIIETIKDFDFKKKVNYYAKKENIKIYIPSMYEVYITDLSNAMKTSKKANIYYFNSEAENRLVVNYDFIELMNNNNLYDSVKAINIYSPFVEVKQDKKIYKNLSKNNVVKMLLNGAVSKIVCNLFDDYEGGKQDLIDNVSLVNEIMNNNHSIYQINNIININARNNLNYELYI